MASHNNIFSPSNTKDYFKVYLGGSSTRLPQDDPEGIIGQLDTGGKFINTGAIAVTETEILDLISEGEIEGLVTGDFNFVGTQYNIGYTSVTARPYDIPEGLTDSERWLRSVYWNKIPLVDSNNKYNFSNISVSQTIGTPNGENISTRTELTATRVYGERLRSVYLDDQGKPVGNNTDYIKIYRLLNPNAIGVKVNVRFGALYKRNITQDEYGDMEQTTVEYTIQYRAIFSDGKTENWSPITNEKITGKLSNPYIHSTRVIFDRSAVTDLRAFMGWELQIIRLTPDSIYSTIGNATSIDSITEIYGNKFLFPNSAMVRSKFNAEFFAQIPERAFDAKLLKVKIPSNYDPLLRAYTGDWDGTFKNTKYWTDNPAWCYYDLITNQRYGLGKYIGEDYFDKWTLYEIAKYCDTLVPDGFGGIEPRFTCNLLINTKEEAFKVINDFASIFRSIVYYAAGSLYMTQDKEIDLESDILMQFTNADVENGNFIYTSTPKNSRNTVALVRYNDKTNFYKPAVEYVQDVDLIKKYGRRDFEFSSFGCTSRGQAIREARYVLYSQNYQAETVTFRCGAQAALMRPGDIFKTSDINRGSDRLGGRFFSGVSGTTFYLDDNLTGYFSGKNSHTFSLSISSPHYNFEPAFMTGAGELNSADFDNIRSNYIQKKTFTLSNISYDSGLNRTKIILPSSIDNTGYLPIPNASWIIEDASDTTNYAEYWKVIDVQEDRNKEISLYNIFGLKFDNNKFLFIESGLKFENTIQPGNTLTPEADISNLLITRLDSSSANANVGFSFLRKKSTSANDSVALLMKEGSDFTPSDLDGLNYTQYIQSILPSTQSTGVLFVETNGRYYFKAHNIKDNGLLGVSNTSYNTGFNFMRSIDDIIVSSLTVDGDNGLNNFGQGYTGYYTGVSPTFTWRVGNYAKDIYDSDNIEYRVTIRPISNSSTPSGQIYYQETGIKFNVNQPYAYTFDIYKNRSTQGGPYRNYDIVIEAHDSDGNSSAGGNFANNINALGYNDSNFSNAVGYDILTAYNPAITYPYLSTGNASVASSFSSGDFHTTQSLNPNGSFALQLITGKYLIPDLKGGYLYYSTSGSFTGLDVLLTGSRADINKVRFSTIEALNYYPASYDIGIGLQENIRSGYFAYSLFDSFDNVDVYGYSGLNISNTLLIPRTYSSIYQTGQFVGINVAAPQANLHVSGTLRLDLTTVNSATSDGQYIEVNVTGLKRYIQLFR